MTRSLHRGMTALCSFTLVAVVIWSGTLKEELTVEDLSEGRFIRSNSFRANRNYEGVDGTSTYETRNAKNYDAVYEVHELFSMLQNDSLISGPDSLLQAFRNNIKRNLDSRSHSYQNLVQNGIMSRFHTDADAVQIKPDSRTQGSQNKIHGSLNNQVRSPDNQIGTSSSKINARPRVLLVSYMRSGSTFTGDIFQAIPGVFYIYEPLLYVNDDDYTGRSYRSVRSRLITAAASIPSPPEIHNYTMDMLNCRLSDHNLRFLFGSRFSNSTAEFEVCQKRLGAHPTNFGNCSIRLRQRCRQSNAVVIKILRLKIWEVEKLLVEDPDLKVIHLVRDPRGVAVSRRAVRYYFVDATFCHRLNEDSQLSADLQAKYPGRILTIRYEDLAMNAPEMVKTLFTFAGVPWSELMDVTIKQMTANSDQATKEESFNTKRKNSSMTAFSWRPKISFQQALRLQDLCRPSMEAYGYLPFENDRELRDQNVPSLEKDYSENFFKGRVI